MRTYYLMTSGTEYVRDVREIPGIMSIPELWRIIVNVAKVASGEYISDDVYKVVYYDTTPLRTYYESSSKESIDEIEKGLSIGMT